MLAKLCIARRYNSTGNITFARLDDLGTDELQILNLGTLGIYNNLRVSVVIVHMVGETATDRDSKA